MHPDLERRNGHRSRFRSSIIQTMPVYNTPATNHINDSAVIKPIPRMQRKVLISNALAEESQVGHSKPRCISIDNEEEVLGRK